MTQATIRTVASTLLLGTLSACGGGGGDDAPIAPLLADGTPAEGDACASDYYRGLIGTYTGPIDYDASGESDAGGSVCRYELAIEIRPRNIGTGMCDLEAIATSTVEQSVVLPIESPVASECREADETLVLLDPLAAVDNPVLGVDYTMPVRLEYQVRGANAPARGPYFGDESVSVRYVNLFGGLVPEVDALAIDEEGIVLEQRDASPERVIRGTLARQ